MMYQSMTDYVPSKYLKLLCTKIDDFEKKQSGSEGEENFPHSVTLSNVDLFFKSS